MKTCIVNVGIGGWYPKGTARLERSLKDHYRGDVLFYNNELPPNAKPHAISNYGFKIHAVQQAINKGYDLIIWLDCSMYAIKDLQPFIDLIEKRGYYFINNGYNAAQTLTDNALKNLKCTRDEAGKITEVASGCFGLNMKDPRCHDFFNLWKMHERLGSFNGNRVHDLKDSADPRFLFSRHEQSVASVLLHRLGMNELSSWGKEACYAEHGINDESMIVCKGM